MRLFKPSTKEYTQDMLPQNRRQVFFDVVKLHFTKLLFLGLIIFAFSLPLHLSSLFGDIYVGNINAKIMETTGEQQKELISQVIAFDNLRALVNIALWIIFAVGFSGVQRVVRQYAWEQNVFTGHDFATGVKQNVGQNVLLALIVGGCYALAVAAYNMASQISGALAVVFMLPVGIFIFLVIPMCAYATVTIPIYGNKFKNNLWIALTLYLKHPLKTFLALLCCGFLLVLLFIPNLYCHIVGRIALSFMAPFAMLGFYLFSFNMLDDIVNKDKHPELVGLGTFKKSE